MNQEQQTQRPRVQLLSDICGILGLWNFQIIFGAFNIIFFSTLILNSSIFDSYKSVISSHILFLVHRVIIIEPIIDSFSDCVRHL